MMIVDGTSEILETTKERLLAEIRKSAQDFFVTRAFEGEPREDEFHLLAALNVAVDRLAKGRATDGFETVVG
jgi:hypothetical protein